MENQTNISPELHETESLAAALLAHPTATGSDAQLAILAEMITVESARDPGDETFLEKCRLAASAAHDIARLATHRERIGFVPLPFGQYVELLGRSAGINVAALAPWTKVSDLAQVTEQSVAAITLLSRRLGMDLRQALLHIRLSLTADAAGVPLAALSRSRAARTGAAIMSMEQCELALASLDNLLDDDTRRQIARISGAVQRGYARSKP